MSFETSHSLAHDQVAAIVQAEILTDPARAGQYATLLRHCLVVPRPIDCAPALPSLQAHVPDQIAVWLVLEEPAHFGERQFIVFDPARRSFHVGCWSGEQALVLGRSGGLFSMVDWLASGSR